MRTDFIFYEEYHKQSTDKKICGRHMVGSTTVFSIPRMESVRSDRPFYLI